MKSQLIKMHSNETLKILVGEVEVYLPSVLSSLTDMAWKWEKKIKLVIGDLMKVSKNVWIQMLSNAEI